MGRHAVHAPDAMLDAARELVLDGGPRAATVGAIACRSGAPKGSIYHRFASLEDLLGAMWIRAVRRSQALFAAALEHRDPVEAAVAGALSLHAFVEREPADARLLASLRREDLLGSVTSPELLRQLDELNRPVAAAISALARRLSGSASRTAVEQTVFAVIDLPMGATRRHLVDGSPLPATLRPQLEAAVRAALEVR
jgi:AcrR family transcriptional regulator